MKGTSSMEKMTTEVKEEIKWMIAKAFVAFIAAFIYGAVFDDFPALTGFITAVAMIAMISGRDE